MGPEDAISDYCPYCRQSDRLVRAVDVRQDAGVPVLRSVDVALPGYEMWSGMLVAAVGLLFLGAAATLGSVDGMSDGAAEIYGCVSFVALVLGGVGYARTRRNVARMRSLEPVVRRHHTNAWYCENCERIHFRAPQSPPGVQAHVAWTVPDYRRELWYACGFVKAGAWGAADGEARRHP